MVNLHNSTAGSRLKISSMQSSFKSVKEVLDFRVTRVELATFPTRQLFGDFFFACITYFFCFVFFEDKRFLLCDRVLILFCSVYIRINLMLIIIYQQKTVNKAFLINF